MVVGTDLTVPRRANTKIIRACLVTQVTDWSETHLDTANPPACGLSLKAASLSFRHHFFEVPER